MYQVNQAYKSPSGSLIIRTENGWEYLFGGTLVLAGVTPPTATEAEILAEAAKHGWGDEEWLYSPSGWINIGTTNDVWHHEFEPLDTLTDLAIFGNECIIADRLIKALNLAKP